MKKINDKKLLRNYRETMRNICESPYQGGHKVGDLSGLFTVGFRYVDGEHRIAYTVVEDEGTEPFVLILLVGTSQTFYEELKRIWTGQ
ncbi:MAG: type II toxin-antitoxin system RelE/ParE family toxin [Alicyclobacillus mali]|nr:type II toxin-antitoxin system RelE/ParE family toxin [Alicyclobacillus mali (ex Roth et al. 2021)]